METKICKRCKLEKLVNNFFKDSSSSDGYCMTCKECRNETKGNRSRTVIGLIEKMYWSQHGTSLKKNFPKPKYSKQEFIEWVIFNPDFKRLYYDWVNSDYDKMTIPSVDRIDNYKGYEFGNIQLMSWQENSDKNRSDTINGLNTKRSRIILVYIKGIFYNKYNSIAIASRTLNITRTNIHAVLKGKRNQMNGFVFLYADSNEDIIKKRSLYIKNDTGVIGINKTTGEVLEFNSIKEAQLKTNSFNISEVCSGKHKSSNGFNWSYKMGELNN